MELDITPGREVGIAPAKPFLEKQAQLYFSCSRSVRLNHYHL